MLGPKLGPIVEPKLKPTKSHPVLGSSRLLASRTEEGYAEQPKGKEMFRRLPLFCEISDRKNDSI